MMSDELWELRPFLPPAQFRRPLVNQPQISYFQEQMASSFIIARPLNFWRACGETS